MIHPRHHVRRRRRFIRVLLLADLTKFKRGVLHALKEQQ